ncbi:MAG: HD domain-containing protein, partial [Acidobacteria bacterium]|nr:HD domain-containing protein [Acidobacteriota bacterium]
MADAMPAEHAGIHALPGAARVAVAIVGAAGIACVAFGLGQIAPGQGPAMLVLAALAVITAGIKIPLPLSEGGSTLSPSYVVSLIAVLLVGPWASAPIAFAGALSQCTVGAKPRNPWFQTLFTMGTMAISTVASGLAYDICLHSVPAESWTRFVAVASAATVYFLLNTGLVGAVIAVSSGDILRRSWIRSLLRGAPSYYVGAAAALLVAVLLQNGRHWWVLLLAAPAYLTYRSYRAYSGRIAEEQRQVKELSEVQLAMIEALAVAIEAKDSTSHDHLRRMQVYCEGLARAISMTEPDIRGVKTAALLHDIGNLAIPEHILSKPGKLSYEEYEKLKIHPRVGADIIRSVPFPYPVAPLVLSHHERWDGRGYPSGLKGEDIPVGARIIAVVDCFTSMLMGRPYRPARTYA